jgi:hypothetical protein
MVEEAKPSVVLFDCSAIIDIEYTGDEDARGNREKAS